MKGKTLFTLIFWRAAFERAVKSTAQFVVLAFFGGDVIFNVFEANWMNMLGVAAGAFLLSVLTSLGTAAVTDGNPSANNAEVLEKNGRHEAV